MQQSKDKVQLVTERQAAIRGLIAIARVPEGRWCRLAWPNGSYSPTAVKADLEKHATLIQQAEEYVKSKNWYYGYMTTSIVTVSLFGGVALFSVVCGVVGADTLAIPCGAAAGILGVVSGVLFYKCNSAGLERDEKEKAYVQALKADIVMSCSLPKEQDANDLYQVKIDANTVMPLDLAIPY